MRIYKSPLIFSSEYRTIYPVFVDPAKPQYYQTIRAKLSYPDVLARGSKTYIVSVWGPRGTFIVYEGNPRAVYSLLKDKPSTSYTVYMLGSYYPPAIAESSKQSPHLLFTDAHDEMPKPVFREYRTLDWMPSVNASSGLWHHLSSWFPCTLVPRSSTTRMGRLKQPLYVIITEEAFSGYTTIVLEGDAPYLIYEHLNRNYLPYTRVWKEDLIQPCGYKSPYPDFIPVQTAFLRYRATLLAASRVKKSIRLLRYATTVSARWLQILFFDNFPHTLSRSWSIPMALSPNPVLTTRPILYRSRRNRNLISYNGGMNPTLPASALLIGGYTFLVYRCTHSHLYVVQCSKVLDRCYDLLSWIPARYGVLPVKTHSCTTTKSLSPRWNLRYSPAVIETVQLTYVYDKVSNTSTGGSVSRLTPLLHKFAKSNLRPYPNQICGTWFGRLTRSRNLLLYLASCEAPSTGFRKVERRGVLRRDVYYPLLLRCETRLTLSLIYYKSRNLVTKYSPLIASADRLNLVGHDWEMVQSRYFTYPQKKFVDLRGRRIFNEKWFNSLRSLGTYRIRGCKFGLIRFKHHTRRTRYAQYRNWLRLLWHSPLYFTTLVTSKPDRDVVSKLYTYLNSSLVIPQRSSGFDEKRPIFSNYDLRGIRMAFGPVFNLSRSQVFSILRVCILVNRVWLDPDLNRDRKIWLFRALRQHFFHLAIHQLSKERFLTGADGGGISPIWLRGLCQDHQYRLVDFHDVELYMLESKTYTYALFSVLWVLKTVKVAASTQVVSSLWSTKSQLRMKRDKRAAVEATINWTAMGLPNDQYNWFYRVGDPNLLALSIRTFSTGIAYSGWRYQYDKYHKYRKRRQKMLRPPRLLRWLHKWNKRVPLWDQSSSCERRYLTQRRHLKNLTSRWFVLRHAFWNIIAHEDYSGSVRTYHVKQTYYSYFRMWWAGNTTRIDHRQILWRYRLVWSSGSFYPWGTTPSVITKHLIESTLLKIYKNCPQNYHLVNYVRAPSGGLRSLSNSFRPFVSLFWLPTEVMYSHVLLRLAAVRLGRRRYYDYALTANSTFIFDARIASMYISLLEESGLNVEPVIVDTMRDPLVLQAAHRLFANRCEWEWSSSYRQSLQQHYPLLMRYHGYRFSRKRRRIQSTIRHWEISLNPGWWFPTQLPSDDPLCDLLFLNQIEVTVACLFYTLECAPRYREDSSLDTFRSHRTHYSLYESIQNSTWSTNPWRQLLRASKSDLLSQPGVRYVKLVDLIVTSWVHKLWSQRLTNYPRRNTYSPRRQRVRTLRRATKFIGATTLRLNLQNHLFREQIESWIQAAKSAPITEIPLFRSGEKDWLMGTYSFTLLIEEMKSWIELPIQKSDLHHQDFRTYALLQALNEVITDLALSKNLKLDDLILLQEFSEDLLLFTRTDSNAAFGKESITIIENY